MGHDRAKIGTDMSFWGKNRSYYRKKNCSHDQPRGEPRGKSKNNRFFARFSCLIFFSQKKWFIRFICQKYTFSQFFENFQSPGHPGATIKGRPKRQIVAADIKESREELVVCAFSKFSFDDIKN